MKTIIVQKPLLVSSICMFLGNIPFIVISDDPIRYFFLTAISTSILNHSHSNDSSYKIYVRWIDRLCMYITISYYIYMYPYEKLIIGYIGIILYFLSKLTNILYLHILSHICACIFFHNTILLKDY